MNSHLNFMQNSLFKPIPNVSKECSYNSYFEFEKQKLIRGNMIYREGEEVDYIYIIKKGELEILKQKSLQT